MHNARQCNVMQIIRGGEIFKHTSVCLPADLHAQSKEKGLNFSLLLRTAIVAELKKRNAARTPSDRTLPHMQNEEVPGE